MELRIDLGQIQEVVQGYHILSALMVAHKGAQDAKLGTEAAKLVTPATPAPMTAAEAEETKRRPGRPPKAPDAAVADGVVKRGPGRPPKDPSAKQAQAAAAAQPVGVALAGVPAHDLASALDAGSAKVHEEEGLAVFSNSPLTDPDLADSFGTASEPDDPEAAFDDAELFGLPEEEPEPEPEPVNPYADKSLSELEALWRAEGAKPDRGVHWLRALVEHYHVRSAKDFTREMLIEALTNPTKYMPPLAA